MSQAILRTYTIIPSELYVSRDADRQLREIIQDMGRPGYVLVSRQMGKTNLLLNAKRSLENQETIFVYVDMSKAFRTSHECFRFVVDTAIQAYPHLFSSSEMIIRRDREHNRTSLPPYKEHDFELKRLLNAVTAKIVIVMDEVDSLTDRTFSDEFFSQIRSSYYQRQSFPEYRRLTYILAGAAEPGELIKNPKQSPFNIGQPILLHDFSENEFEKFLQMAQLSIPTEVAKRVYHWTNGHPRMVWDTCAAIETRISTGAVPDIKLVDTIVKELYLERHDRPPIDHIRDLVTRDRRIGTAVRHLLEGNGGSLDGPMLGKLHIAGIIGPSKSTVRIKNRIVEQSLADLSRARIGFRHFADERSLSMLHEAACSGGIADAEQQDRLLRGIDDALVLAAAASESPSERLKKTIRRLNEIERLPDGTVPFATWLRNAILLVASRPEGDIFRRTLGALDGNEDGQDARFASRPLPGLVDLLEDRLIQRARHVSEDIKRSTLTVQIDALVAQIKLRGRVKEGDLVAGTKLLKVIGNGNFGTVYLARRESDGVLTATKVFQLDKLTEGMMLWSFRRSIKAMRHLNHDERAPSSIVRIHEAAEDTLAFSMDYLPGGNLEDVAGRGWTLQRKIDVFAEVCRAVDFAHNKGVIHRDIKPANVVLDEEGRPVLTDFDISDIKFVTKLSVARGGLGTPVFAAPEQLEDGSNASERSDVYSLGRLLYFLLLERSPGYQIEVDPSLDNLAAFPSALVAIVRRSTQIEPTRRYSSVRELIRDVEVYGSRAAGLKALVREVARWVRRSAAMLTIFTVVVSGLIEFAVYQRGVAIEKEKQREAQQQLRKALVESLQNLLAEQNDARAVMDKLNRQLGDIKDQRARLKQEQTLLDQEIGAIAAGSPKLQFLAEKRKNVQTEFEALDTRQKEFDSQVAALERKIRRIEAAAQAGKIAAGLKRE